MTTQEIEVDNWKALPWKTFQKTVFRLQTRIFKARKNGDRKLVCKLQKLLLNSQAAKYLAVRQVTQLNQGKTTAEATFHSNSYGFRPGRGAHDIQKRLFSALRSSSDGISKTILEMDIEKCFDQISHETILQKTELPKIALKGLRLAIKAGVRGEYPSSTTGTPQGGVISPLLANIALNGIEDCFKNKNITCLRYADDLVFLCKPGVNQYELRLSINLFLEERGLQVKESKTKFVNSTVGFDFLGWNFKVKPNGKFISTPSQENTQKVKAKIKVTMKDSRFTLIQRIAKCGSLVRGWRNYNRYCDMTSHDLWAQAYWTWKYIRKQGSFDRQGTNEAIHQAFPSVTWRACSHNNVTGDKSPFDGDFTYWAKRENKNYSGINASLLKQQNHKCKACGLSFLSGDKVELHHADGNHNNWQKSNLQMLHHHCHQHQPIHGEARVARNSQKEK